MPYQDLTTRQQALDEFGEDVTIGGVTARCLVDDADDEMAADTNTVLVGRGHRLRAATGTFPTVAMDDSVTFRGTTYTVVAVRLMHPGDYQRVIIAKV